MAEYSFKLKVEASNEEEARKVAVAMNDIYKLASNADIVTLANAVKNKPGLIKKALKWI